MPLSWLYSLYTYTYELVEGKICECGSFFMQKNIRKRRAKKSNQKWIFGSIRMHRMVYARVTPQWTELEWKRWKNAADKCPQKTQREREKQREWEIKTAQIIPITFYSMNFFAHEYQIRWKNALQSQLGVFFFFFLSFFCRFACLANRPKYYYMHHKKGIFFFSLFIQKEKERIK